MVRCPHCGAPVEASPYAPTARCAYCGHTVQLLAPEHRPIYPAPAYPAPRSGALFGVYFRAALVLAVMAVAVIVPLVTSRLSSQPAPVAATVAVPAHGEAQRSNRAPASAEPAVVSYPLPSLLGISPTVDIDQSRAHLLGLFPTITSQPRADQLSYHLPIGHPWFSSVDLNWKNEQAGKLVSVAFNPPAHTQQFKNQKEIADCLATGLGKPEVREMNHLTGELSYWWGAHFPKATADLYSGYLWLTFEDPKGVAPITFATIVRTLTACAAHAP